MIQLKWQNAVLLLLAACAIGFFVRTPHETHESHVAHESQRIRERLDTAHSVVTVPLAAVSAHGATNRIRTRTVHDTIYSARCLDTLVRQDTSQVSPDTLSVCYARGVFFIALGLAPRRRAIDVPFVARDTFFAREDTVRITSSQQRNWYEDVLTVLVSIAAGIVIAKL